MRVLLALLVAAQNSVVPAPPPPLAPLPPQTPAPDSAHLLIPSREAPVHVGGGDATYRYVSANAAFAPAAPPLSQRDTTVLRVLAINDFHGALEARSWPWSGGRAVGGAAALKPWLDSLARACGCTTVRLDGGDEMQGTLLSNFTFGLPAIAVMNAFGIDAAAIGNHEFDWSVDTLRARMAGAKYRFLAANITDSSGTARPEWAEPWTLTERGGLKVAVIGLALRATPTNTAPRNVRGLAFGEGAAAVRRVLPRARAAADFVIVLAHEGAFCDGAPGPDPVPAPVCHGEIMDIARGLDSGVVDLIVSGHTHSLVNTVVNGIPIVQARSSGAGIAAGTATYGDLYQVQPFQNRLVRLFVSGKVLMAALEHAVAGDRADAHVSGLEVWYDPRKRVGQRVTKVRLANGHGLDNGRTYTVAVSDFLAAGGSGYTMFRGLPVEDLGLVDLDALIQYLAVLRPPVEAPGDGRVHRVGAGR